MLIKDIIKTERLKHNLSMNDLALKLGVSESTVSRWESGEIASMKHSVIKQLSKILEISPMLLLGESSEKDCIEEHTANVSTTSMLFYDNICVNCSSPIMPEYSDIEVKEIELPNIILGDIAGKSNLVAIKSRGDSMDKIIPEYSLVIIQKLLPYENIESGDIVMYSYEDSWSIKEFIKKDDCVIFRPHSTNPHHKDNIYKFSDMEDGMSVPKIIGKVVYYGVSL